MSISPEKINIRNRKASFEYEFLDTYTAGLQLTGTEIKSVRESQANLSDGYCLVINGEVFARNIHISEYKQGTYNNHIPKRDRKLLLNGAEIRKIISKLRDKGITIVPLRIFISESGYAKLDIAVARGKKIYDKRDDIKKRDVERSLRRAD